MLIPGTGIAVVGGVPVNPSFGGATSSYKLDDDQAVLYTAPNLSYPLYFKYFFNRSGLPDGQHTLVVSIAVPEENLPQGEAAGSTLVFDYVQYTPSLELSQEAIPSVSSSFVTGTIVATGSSTLHSTTSRAPVSQAQARRIDVGLTVGVVLACIGGMLSLVCAIILLRRKWRARSRVRGMDLLHDNSTYSTLGSEATVTPYMESFPHTPVTYGIYLPSSTVVHPGTGTPVTSPPSYAEHGSFTPRGYLSSSKTASVAGSSAARDTVYSLPPRVVDDTRRSDDGSDGYSASPPTYRTAPSTE